MSIIEFFLAGVCHQIPERCLLYQGVPMPLCARCTATFLGVVLGMVLLLVTGQGRRSELPTWRGALVPLMLVFLWGVDGTNSFAQMVLGRGILYAPSNTMRVLTGMGFGLALAVVLYPVYHYALWRDTEERQVLAGARRLTGGVPGPVVVMLSAGLMLALALLTMPMAPYWLWTTLAVAAVAIVLTMVNAILIVLLAHKEGLAKKWTDLIPWFAAGLAAALLETGVLSLIRQVLA